MSLAHIGNRLRIRGTCNGSVPREAGHEVMCTDIDAARSRNCRLAESPFTKEHLEEVLVSARKAGRISYTSDATEAIRFGDAIFICVGTPPRRTAAPIFSAIDHVAQQIAAVAQNSKLIVEKSTSCANRARDQPGARGLFTRRSRRFAVVSNPSSFGKARRFSIFPPRPHRGGRGRRSRGNGHA